MASGIISTLLSILVSVALLIPVSSSNPIEPRSQTHEANVPAQSTQITGEDQEDSSYLLDYTDKVVHREGCEKATGDLARLIGSAEYTLEHGYSACPVCKP